jgi:hypothetical protein
VVSYLTTSPSNGNKDYPPPYTFRRIRILHQTWKGRDQRKVEGGKKERKSRGRSSPYTTESPVIDHRRKLEEVDIDDKDKESMDEGIMSDI